MSPRPPPPPSASGLRGSEVEDSCRGDRTTTLRRSDPSTPGPRTWGGRWPTSQDAGNLGRGLPPSRELADRRAVARP